MLEVLAALDVGIPTAHFPNLNDVCATLSAGNIYVATQLHQYGLSCVQPRLSYFRAKFTEDLKGSVDTFKAACQFVPQKVADMEQNANAINSLAVFNF